MSAANARRFPAPVHRLIRRFCVAFDPWIGHSFGIGRLGFGADDYHSNVFGTNQEACLLLVFKDDHSVEFKRKTRFHCFGVGEPDKSHAFKCLSASEMYGRQCVLLEDTADGNRFWFRTCTGEPRQPAEKSVRTTIAPTMTAATAPAMLIVSSNGCIGMVLVWAASP